MAETMTSRTLTTTMTNPHSHTISTGKEDIELPRWRGKGHKPPTSISYESTTTFDDGISPSTTLTPDTSSPPSYPQSTTLATLTPTRTLIYTRSIFWSDQTISDALSPQTPLYHASTHCLDIRQPDLILYASSSDTLKAHLLAAAHFRFSRHARLGFGSDLAQLNGKDTHDGAVAWEMLRNTSAYCRHYQYDFSVPCNHPRGTDEHDNDAETTSRSGGTRHFRLQRTHAATDGVDGWLGWASFRIYVLVDLATREEIGVFLSDDLRSLTRMGELRLYEALGKEVLAGVVLAVGIVVEKHIRRMRRSGKGGGGGGGDGGG